jgi:hypothetical protein
LLEKAYAKLNGCYEALQFGSPTSAFVDLSGESLQSFPEYLPQHTITKFLYLGNVPEQMDLRSPEIIAEYMDDALFDMMIKEMNRGALMSCSIQTPDKLPGRENELGKQPFMY